MVKRDAPKQEQEVAVRVAPRGTSCLQLGRLIQTRQSAGREEKCFLKNNDTCSPVLYQLISLILVRSPARSGGTNLIKC